MSEEIDIVDAMLYYRPYTPEFIIINNIDWRHFDLARRKKSGMIRMPRKLKKKLYGTIK